MCVCVCAILCVRVRDRLVWLSEVVKAEFSVYLWLELCLFVCEGDIHTLSLEHTHVFCVRVNK